jgi:hypothetical protein
MNQLTIETTTHRERLLGLLLRHAPDWVPLPAVLLDLGIAQYDARIFELRRIGYWIENKQDDEHSWFRLVVANAATATILADLNFPTSALPESLFTEIPQRHRDDG